MGNASHIRMSRREEALVRLVNSALFILQSPSVFKSTIHNPKSDITRYSAGTSTHARFFQEA